MKLKLNKKTWCLFAFVAIFLIVLMFVMKYVLITKPLKDELVSKAFDYIKLDNTIWVLPEQYRSNPEMMPETEIQAHRNLARSIIDHYLLPGTITERRAIETCDSLIDDQLNGELFVIKEEVYMGKLVKAKIKSDRAEFVFHVNFIDHSVSRGWGYWEKDLWSEYSIQFVKHQGEWKIRILQYRPIDLPEGM